VLFPVSAAERLNIKKYNALKYKSVWLDEYYNEFKTMRSNIIMFQIENSSVSLGEISKKFSKVTPNASLIKEIRIVGSGEDLVATIHLKDPESGFFKENILTGQCLGTNVAILNKYCR